MVTRPAKRRPETLRTPMQAGRIALIGGVGARGVRHSHEHENEDAVSIEEINKLQHFNTP